MFVPSKSTSALLATFLVVSASATAGCTNEQNENEVSLVDDHGNDYQLVRNDDGTETARYSNGDEVTFKKNDDGSLDYVSGTAGLLAGLAAGYFLFHGLNSSGGYYDTSRNRYISNEKPSVMSNYDRDKALNKYKEEKQRGSGTAVVSNTNSNSDSSKSSASSSSAKSETKSSTSNSTAKSSTPSSTAKSGFGSAGARSGGSAAS